MMRLNLKNIADYRGERKLLSNKINLRENRGFGEKHDNYLLRACLPALILRMQMTCLFSGNILAKSLTLSPIHMSILKYIYICSKELDQLID